MNLPVKQPVYVNEVLKQVRIDWQQHDKSRETGDTSSFGYEAAGFSFVKNRGLSDCTEYLPINLDTL